MTLMSNPKTKKKPMNATQKLRKHLEAGRSITPLQALDKWGCMRLGARILELRQEGWNIITETVKKNGKRYAKYSLA
jgi:hypothetical protein